jgi:hypothetical protein
MTTYQLPKIEKCRMKWKNCFSHYSNSIFYYIDCDYEEKENFLIDDNTNILKETKDYDYQKRNK